MMRHWMRALVAGLAAVGLLVSIGCVPVVVRPPRHRRPPVVVAPRHPGPVVVTPRPPGPVGVGPGPGPVVVVPMAPPPPRREVRPKPPRPGHVWVGGHWVWSGGRYVWHGGRWTAPPRHGATHAPGRWTKGPKGWHFTPGRWH